MPEDMPENMPDAMSDRMPEDMPEDLPDRMPEDMPEDMPDRMPKDMADRMPEDLPVRKCINVMVGITRSKVIFFQPQNLLLGTIGYHPNIHIIEYLNHSWFFQTSNYLEKVGFSSFSTSMAF